MNKQKNLGYTYKYNNETFKELLLDIPFYKNKEKAKKAAEDFKSYDSFFENKKYKIYKILAEEV